MHWNRSAVRRLSSKWTKAWPQFRSAGHDTKGPGKREALRYIEKTAGIARSLWTGIARIADKSSCVTDLCKGVREASVDSRRGFDGFGAKRRPREISCLPAAVPERELFWPDSFGAWR